MYLCARKQLHNLNLKSLRSGFLMDGGNNFMGLGQLLPVF
jgi:hypothetical protein